MTDEEEDKWHRDNLGTLATEAVREARQATLDAGLSVTEINNGWLVEQFPDGTIKKLKEMNEFK